jgi:hypothetical protein
VEVGGLCFFACCGPSLFLTIRKWGEATNSGRGESGGGRPLFPCLLRAIPVSLSLFASGGVLLAGRALLRGKIVGAFAAVVMCFLFDGNGQRLEVRKRAERGEASAFDAEAG